MKMRLQTLTIVFRHSREQIDLDSRLVAFHGKSGAGKSSILRIINYCLGGSAPGGQVIQEEFLSAALALTLGSHSVLLERSPAQTPNSVRVSWQGASGTGSMEFPLDAAEKPVFGDDVYSFSDMVFCLTGAKPMYMTIRRNGIPTSVRLSIRDLLWYCHIRQHEVASNFFNLGAQGKEIKSRKAFEYIVGSYTEHLSSLEQTRAEIEGQLKANLTSAERLAAFLKDLGYGSKEDMQAEIESISERLEEASERVTDIRRTLHTDTHPLDDLRFHALEMTEALQSEQDALDDLKRLIADNTALRADLISMKFKLARSTTADEILAGVNFLSCPSCGQHLPRRPGDDACGLCGQERAPREPQAPEVLSADLDERIDELDKSISRMSAQLKSQSERIRRLDLERDSVERRLSEETAAYSSRSIAEMRQAEYERARLEEERRHLTDSLRLPETVDRILDENVGLDRERRRLVEQIDAERGKLASAETEVQQIEVVYKKALLAVRFPDFHEGDEVRINRRTWIPEIWPRGNAERAWTFFDEASSGKKSLLNVCYALAVHAVADERELQAPTLLMIDTPTAQGIDREIDQEMFDAFYRHLYETIRRFKSTQVVIVENKFICPPDGTSYLERRMTRDDPAYPPLIPYRLEAEE